MRLTLRIILSWMNQVLGPEDARTIETQIAQDEASARLVRRIEEAVRKTALQTGNRDIPTIDPNLVAEYLDNDLSPENSLDFERICLESDGNLAEAAACYHILTDVLSGVAPPEPDLRRRLCELVGPQKTTVDLPMESPVGPAETDPEPTPQNLNLTTERNGIPFVCDRGNPRFPERTTPSEKNVTPIRNPAEEEPEECTDVREETTSGGVLIQGIPVPPPL
ncbi:MAG: hypothetical protein Q4C47_09990, partial [Planctomycetia bacterium]|nr:hypothetical protein [Planctomycetia bacterium]